MADISLVYMRDYFEQLGEHKLQVWFGCLREVGEVREWEVLHDQVGNALLEIEVEGVVADDAGVAQLLDGEEVFLQLQDVFLVHADDLHRVDLSRLAVLATVHAGVGALSYHLKQRILLVEAVHVATLLLLVFIRVLPQQPFREESVSQLQTLPAEADLLLLGLDLEAILGNDLDVPQRLLDALDSITPRLSLTHYYRQNL
jgi:hypothetical protein